MKWRELKDALKKKLHAEIEIGSDHDWGYVKCGDMYIGRVKIGRHVEMHSREVGGSASMLKINEHDLKALVSCTLSGEKYCERVARRLPLPGK